VRGVRNTERGIEVVEVADPEPGDDDVVVHVQSSSICGSDLHLIEYGPIPFTLGHEFAGVTDDGEAVAIDPSQPCGTCDMCTTGAAHLCRTASQRARGISADGGLSDAIAVHTSALVPLPDGLTPTTACLVEPLGVATHATRLAGLRGGERVAVVGAGSIGLAAIAAARARASEVGMVARHDQQRVAGERLGAVTAGGEYDVVFECAGSESALVTAAELCRPGARIVFLSTHWTPVAIPGLPALMKELGFQWSYTYSAHEHGTDLGDAAALLASDPDIADTLITHRFPLDDAAEAFRVAGDRAAGAIKVTLEP
jgi:2-desacetyl-2-hydroxyethyl bacteriochlorophyllide A dehydrogenase